MQELEDNECFALQPSTRLLAFRFFTPPALGATVFQSRASVSCVTSVFPFCRPMTPLKSISEDLTAVDSPEKDSVNHQSFSGMLVSLCNDMVALGATRVKYSITSLFCDAKCSPPLRASKPRHYPGTAAVGSCRSQRSHSCSSNMCPPLGTTT